MGNWETDWDRDVLERIVALLLALAGLADRAAGLPIVRRRHVLGILNCGAAEASAFVMGVAAGAPSRPQAPESAGDAARLAVRLRALALVLCILRACRFELPGAAGPRACRRSRKISGLAVRRLDIPAPPLSDTS